MDREVTRLFYDGLGRRLAKEYDPRDGSGGVKRTEYGFDGLDPVAEYRLWNGQRAEYYRGGLESFSPTPMLLEMRHFPAGSEGQAYWYHLDGRGSVAGLTKHQGQSTHNYRYDAYGQVLPAQGNWTDPHNHYTFLGKEWDEHLGLYEFGFRLYDPWVGVWLTREPLPGRAWEPRTWHRYQYAFASPIRYYDPYGQQTCGFNILTGERECFGERTGMGWTLTLAAPVVPPPVGRLTPQPIGASCRPAYSLRESALQAWGLVYEWFFEVGPSVRTFGPEYAITQDIMHDPGITAFRRAWAEAGYPVPWEWKHSADVRTGGWLPLRIARGGLVYAREHLVQLPLSTALGVLDLGPNDPRSPIDPVGGIIGSLDKIYVWPSEQEGWVRIEVVNVMNWRSGTRVPGTDFSLIDLIVPPDREITRDWAPDWAPWLPIPGGAIEQRFWWEEPRP